ncbi:MAG: DUF3891 family protein [Phormidium sp.]
MIANQHEKGWEIIYHRAHALLAAQIAGNWQKSDRPRRIVETVAAISHHDDLEKEWEGNHLTEVGTPLDFMLITGVPKEEDLEKLRKLINNSRYRGRWVAMLISMHVSFLTEGNRGESSEIDSFLDKQLDWQKQWREELGISKEEAAQTYAFFQLCDRLSLILCNRQLTVGERILEIGKDDKDQLYDVIQIKDQTVYVNPWPFEEESFTVNVEATYLNQVVFENNEALAQALQVAPIKTLEWTFAKS